MAGAVLDAPVSIEEVLDRLFLSVNGVDLFMAGAAFNFSVSLRILIVHGHILNNSLFTQSLCGRFLILGKFKVLRCPVSDYCTS